MRALALSLFSCAAFSATVYTDSSLNLADYTIVEGTVNGSIAYSNPSANFQAVRTMTGAGYAGFAAMNPLFVYDPLMGVLTTIDVSALVSTTLSPWALYIEQDGMIYRAAVTASVSGTPQTSSASGLTADLFQRVDMAGGTLLLGNPDFGSAFILGFGQRLSVTKAATFTITFDDLSITLNTTPIGVPEPATLWLAGVVLGAAVWRRVF